uniref:PWWP domain-containing protein n=1 Tax=Xiphophorus couchianus TaxID=32473 RepID=A0A3B5KYC2_9TELE
PRPATRAASARPCRPPPPPSNTRLSTATSSQTTLPPPPPHTQPSGSRKKPPPPVKFAEGEIVWAKFGRRPWWPCEVLADPALGVHHRMKEPCDRLCRLYHVRTFGEPKEFVWVEEKSTQAFHGGFEFDQLLLLRRRSKQREQNNRNTVSVQL